MIKSKIKYLLSENRGFFSENKGLFSDMFLITVATFVSSFLSYYLNFYVQSLFVDISDFANYLLFITFISLITLIPTTLSTSIIVNVTELKSNNRDSELSSLFWKLMGVFLIISLFFFLGISKFDRELSQVFNISINNFFWFIGAYSLFLVISIPISAFIYGTMQFKVYSSLIIGLVLFKILGVGYFYNQGFGFESVFYGFIFSSIFFIIFGLLFLAFKLEKPDFKIKSKPVIKKIFVFSIPLLFIAIGRDLISYVDFLIVKARFSEVISGNYSLLLNLGKVLLFGSLVILGVMLPQIADSFNRKENYFKKFKIYLYIELFIVFIGLLLFSIFPKFVIDVLIFISGYLGLNSTSFNSYYQILDLLPFYSIFIALVVMINFFTIFLTAIQKYHIFIYYILCLLIQATLLYFFASDILNVIIYNIICASLLMFYLIKVVYEQYKGFYYHSSL